SNDTQLRNAAAAPGITAITFSCGGASTIPISGYIQVQGDVSIDGGNLVTLDGGSTSAFFQIFGTARLDMRNITLQNGTFSSAHALENFGTLVLTNVLMRNNTAIGEGGAIGNYGTLQVSSSTFTGNSTSGTSLIDGGAIVNEGGDVTLLDSTFSGNKVLG